MTCALLVNEFGEYDVWMMPHWDLSSTTVEPYDDAGTAFGRHAQIAMALRSNGWTVVDRAKNYSSVSSRASTRT